MLKSTARTATVKVRFKQYSSTCVVEVLFLRIKTLGTFYLKKVVINMYPVRNEISNSSVKLIVIGIINY